MVIDPHTAVAVAGADKVRTGAQATPLVIVSTAHPAKFPEAVTAAAGVVAEPPRAVRLRSGLAEEIDRLPADLGAVKTYVRAFAAS